MRFLKIVAFFIIGIALARNYVHAEAYGCIKGYVKDKDTRKGIGKAKVILCKETVGAKEWGEVLTDERGFYSLNEVKPWDGYYLSCEKTGYIPLNSSHLRKLAHFSVNKDEYEKIFNTFVIKKGDKKYLEIYLEKGGILKGTICSKTGDVFVRKDAIIYLTKEYEEGDLFSPHPHFNNHYYYSLSHQDNKGEFVFNELKPSRKYVLRIENEGFPPQYVHGIEVKKNKTTTINYTYDLSNKTGIKGTITRNNRLLRGASVLLCKESDVNYIAYSETFNDGQYMIRTVQPGIYYVRIHYIDKRTDGYHDWFVPVKLKPGQMEILNIDFPPSRLSKEIIYRSSTQ